MPVVGDVLSRRDAQVSGDFPGEKIIDFQNGEALSRFCRRHDSHRWNDYRLPAIVRIRAATGAEEDLAASRPNRKRLANYLVGPCCFLGQRPIGLKHQCSRFLQIGARFFQGRSLRIGAGEFLNETKVAFRHTTENCGELNRQAFIIRPLRKGLSLAQRRGEHWPTPGAPGRAREAQR